MGRYKSSNLIHLGTKKWKYCIQVKSVAITKETRNLDQIQRLIDIEKMPTL